MYVGTRAVRICSTDAFNALFGHSEYPSLLLVVVKEELRAEILRVNNISDPRIGNFTGYMQIAMKSMSDPVL